MNQQSTKFGYCTTTQTLNKCTLCSWDGTTDKWMDRQRDWRSVLYAQMPTGGLFKPRHKKCFPIEEWCRYLIFENSLLNFLFRLCLQDLLIISPWCLNYIILWPSKGLGGGGGGGGGYVTRVLIPVSTPSLLSKGHGVCSYFNSLFTPYLSRTYDNKPHYNPTQREDHSINTHSADPDSNHTCSAKLGQPALHT